MAPADQFEEFQNLAQKEFLFKAGNFQSFPSQFYFWKRKYLERKYLN